MTTTSVPISAADQDPRVARSHARMLAAATELLVEAGVRGVTADAVAERSGVAKSTLYRHWSSMPELLLEVMRCNVPEALPVELGAGFEAALRWWMDRGIETLSAPDWARILPALLELRTHSPEMADLLAADFDNNLATVAAILELGAAEGRLPAGLDPRRVTNTLVGPLVLAALNGDHDQLPALADYVLERFLASYAA
jgi:AcrR family transcriptional regulator